MAQIIITAKEYNKRPSEIMGIKNDHAAYCFDEVALYLRARATDNEGRLDWSRIKWHDGKSTNMDLVNFIKSHS